MPFAVIGVVLLLVLIASSAHRAGIRAGVIFRLGRVVAGAKGPRPLLHHPDHRQDGEGQPADRDPRCASTGRHHQGQRDGAGQRGLLLPGLRFCQSSGRGAELSLRDIQIAQTTLRAVLGKVDFDDILTERDRLNADLQRIIDDLTDPGEEGRPGRDQGCRHTGRDAAGDGPAGRGRARETPRSSTPKVSSRPREVGAGGLGDRPPPDRLPTPVSPDDHRGLGREELDARDPDPDRAPQAVPGGLRRRCIGIRS